MVKPIVRDLVVLRRPAKPVLPGEKIVDIVRDLEDTFSTLKGFGLAANQIGYDKAVAIVHAGKDKFVLVNPKIIDKSERIVFPGESCFSMPGLFLDTDRWLHVTVEHGHDKKQEQFSNLLAVVMQHEIDHLHGITIRDRKHKSR